MAVTQPALTCYACGHAYDYIGAEPHPGVCPECGDRRVSPSGRLTLCRPEPIEIEGDNVLVEQMRRVCAHDASDREFQYWLSFDGDEATLLRVVIAGESVDLHAAVKHGAVPLVSLEARLQESYEISGLTVKGARVDGDR